MMKKIISFCLACCIFIFAFSSCSNDLKKLPKEKTTKDFTIDVADTVRIIISEKDKTKAEISAPQFIRDEKSKPPFIEMPKGLKAQFFDDSLQVSTTLTARYGRYYVNNKNIIVKDSVVVINKEGNELRTNELIWNNNLEQFFSETDVYIYSKDYIIYGEGFQSNRDFTNISFKKQKGLIPVAKGMLTP